MPQNSDAMFAALQNEVQGISAPSHRVSLQESIIDSIPLAVAAMSGDDATMGIVSGIINRRKQQEDMMFQNELDLRKLQLDAAIKGITLERDKLESTARIGASEAETTLRGAQLEQTRQETRFAGEIQPLKIKKATAEITSEESLTKGRELQSKITEQEVKHTLERAALLRKLEQGDETDRRIWQAITLTGNMPSSKEQKPRDLLEEAQSDPRLAILSSEFKAGRLTDPIQINELQAGLEMISKPETKAVFAVTAPVNQIFSELAKKDGITVGKEPLSKKTSDIFTQQVVDIISPHYKDLIKLGLRGTLRTELKSILENVSLKTKYKSVDALEKDIALNATNLDTAERQKEYIEKQVGDLLNKKTAEEEQINRTLSGYEGFEEPSKFEGFKKTPSFTGGGGAKY